MYKTYRPKGSSVKAIQITDDTAEFAAGWCHGRVVRMPDQLENGKNTVAHVLFPTMDGVKQVETCDYLMYSTQDGFMAMSQQEFENHYEPAKRQAGDKSSNGS